RTLAVIDVSTPAAPVLLSTVPSHCTDVCVVGRYAYCPGGNDISVIDLQDRQHATAIAQVCAPVSSCGHVPGAVWGVGTQGLSLFFLQCNGPTEVLVSDLQAHVEPTGVVLSWRADSKNVADFTVMRRRDGEPDDAWNVLQGQPRHLGVYWSELDAG